jgi:acyl carrier protein
MPRIEPAWSPFVRNDRNTCNLINEIIKMFSQNRKLDSLDSVELVADYVIINS